MRRLYQHTLHGGFGRTLIGTVRKPVLPVVGRDKIWVGLSKCSPESKVHFNHALVLR